MKCSFNNQRKHHTLSLSNNEMTINFLVLISLMVTDSLRYQYFQLIWSRKIISSRNDSRKKVISFQLLLFVSC